MPPPNRRFYMRRPFAIRSNWIMAGRKFSGHIQEAIAKRRWRWLVVAAALYGLFGGDFGLVRLIGLTHEQAALSLSIKNLEARHAQLQADLRKYTSDPFAIEIVAREQLDWGRRGETVYKFPSKQP